MKKILSRANPETLPHRRLPLSAVIWAAGGLLALSMACSAPQRAPGEGGQTVRFSYRGDYRSVCLSGDFNGWSATSRCLRQNGEVWEIELSLPPGRYRYGFVLDGSQWAPDPGVLLQEDDGFGKKNSVLIVK